MLLTLVAALFVAVGIALVVVSAGTRLFPPPQTNEVSQQSRPAAPAIDLSDYDPGYIISDQVFFNYQAMDLNQITAFIEEKNSGCVTMSTPCLSEYTEDTVDVPPSPRCQGYVGAPGESAAQIIFKTAQSCQVNPQVLLVLIQKEQGLITASDYALTPRRYETATGFACPDGAQCDPQYFGFGTQVYYAAAQFQRYRQTPAQFPYQAGRSNDIPFAPGEGCGSAPVVITNQATAALYNYTPYQPDAALLSGAPGECSSYGNANFFGLFKAWFGNPRA